MPLHSLGSIGHEQFMMQRLRVTEAWPVLSGTSMWQAAHLSTVLHIRCRAASSCWPLTSCCSQASCCSPAASFGRLTAVGGTSLGLGSATTRGCGSCRHQGTGLSTADGPWLAGAAAALTEPKKASSLLLKSEWWLQHAVLGSLFEWLVAARRCRVWAAGIRELPSLADCMFL